MITMKWALLLLVLQAVLAQDLPCAGIFYEQGGAVPRQPRDGLRVISVAVEHAHQLPSTRRFMVAARHVYVGWQFRFHVPESMEEDALRTLLSYGGDSDVALVVVQNSDACASWIWPLLALEDPSVEIVLGRSVAMRPSLRELSAVDEWKRSGSPFHVMRDVMPLHDVPIVPCLWGVRRRSFESVGLASLAHQFSESYQDWPGDVEEDFLGKVVWPLIEDSHLAHDSITCTKYTGAVGFPKRRRGWEYVGLLADRYERDVRRAWRLVRDNAVNEDCIRPETVPAEPVFSDVCDYAPYDGPNYVHPPPPALVDNERRYIAFSLYGTNPRYWKGSQNVLDQHADVFPEWRLRFYVAREVPDEFFTTLLNQTHHDIEIFTVPDYPPDIGCPPKMWWRFAFTLDDPGVDRFLVRDLDSPFTLRERHAVDEWVASGRPFHVMRDAPFNAHNYPIMGGMFGIVHGAIVNCLETAMEWWVVNVDRLEQLWRSWGGIDQVFLMQVFWEELQDVMIGHDSFTCDRYRALPFPDAFEWWFIGEVFPVNGHKTSCRQPPQAHECSRPEYALKTTREVVRYTPFVFNETKETFEFS